MIGKVIEMFTMFGIRGRLYLVLLTFLAFGFFASVSGRTSSEIKNEVLTNLRQVAVTIEPLPEELVGTLDEHRLKTSIELRLRQFGLKVKSENFLEPFFYVRFNASKSRSSSLIAYSIDCSLEEDVTVKRTGQHRIATTWLSSSTGSVGVARVQELESDVMSHVDDFVNAWMSANGK